MYPFNLVDDPWLRLRRAETGEITEMGIADALLNADSYGELVVDLPTQFPAIMRQVLLPIVLDALGSPADLSQWVRRFSKGRFDEQEQDALGAYLETHRQRFDLFDSAAPFGQVAGMRTSKGETKGSALLVATAATGNNVPLFASRTEGDPLPLTPTEAVRWLVHAHCWDTAAIKTGVVGDPKAKGGKTTGNPTGPLGQLGVVMPIGRTLYDTLLLNLPIGVGGWLGTPQWTRMSGPEWEMRAANGLLDLWTWQSRRIRLVPEETDEGPRVTRVIVAAGDRLSYVPDREPHTAWRANKPTAKPGKKTASSPVRPLRHTPGKAIWRGLHALLAASRNEPVEGFQTSVLLAQLGGLAAEGLFDESYPLRVETFGMLYGNQSAVVEDVLHDRTPLPVAALRADTEVHEFVLDAVDQAEQLAQAVNRLSDDLRRAAGLDLIPWDKAQRPGERVLHALDPSVRRLLHGLQGNTDTDVMCRARNAWESTAVRATMRVADSVYAAVSESVFAGRENKTDNGTTMPPFGLGRAFHAFYSRVDSTLPSAQQERRKATSSTISRRPSMKRRYWDRLNDDGGWLPVDPTTNKLLGAPPGEDLALMRAGLAVRACELWEMCRFYTFKVNDEEARRGQVSREQEAEHAALGLYGLHQQSKRTSMHRAGVGLGVALRRLRDHGKFSADAVNAKVTAAATTTDPDALLLRLRGLVDLLRTIDQPLDYDRLMWLIYDWHREDRRRLARRRWALEYQVWNQQRGGDAPADPETDAAVPAEAKAS